MLITVFISRIVSKVKAGIMRSQGRVDRYHQAG
jgi:hypothetical protein